MFAISSVEVLMPRLSDSMEEGTVIRWLATPGTKVSRGDPLVEIETDKATLVHEAEVDGTLTEILVVDGSTTAVGLPIARIETGAPGPSESEESAYASTATSVTPSPDRLIASPLARRVASEHSIDLARIHGTGRNGRIIKADVIGALEALPAQPDGSSRPSTSQDDAERPSPTGPNPSSVDPDQPADAQRTDSTRGRATVVDLTRLQRTVADRMAAAKATIPHFYLNVDIDMSQAVEARRALQADADLDAPTPSINDLVIKACALALRDIPAANSAYREGRVEIYSRVNVGVAVAADAALAVPTVFDADQKGLRQIALETRQLTARVREATISPAELTGATFTVSNLGGLGVSSFAAVINPPQAAILAVGAVVERPVVRNGEFDSAHIMPVTLSCDHRVLYGADGARFLARIRALLEQPLGLAL
jgi:pyruvate dehydrogenase E2 component (dihydrolipoamide acetyltransferase)